MNHILAYSGGVVVIDTKMRVESVPTHEVKLYIGSRRNYNGDDFSEKALIIAISAHQKSVPDASLVSLRITPTLYVVKDYCESGWEIAAINYPRFPKDLAVTKRFMFELARQLLARFEQGRISVVCPDETVMFEADKESG